MALKVRKHELERINLADVANVLGAGLKHYFQQSNVAVVDCPDLTREPFNLAAAGLNGECRIADVGGPPYLVPLVQRNKVYSFQRIAQLVGAKGNAFMLGAGAGPFHVVGQNCELMPNVLLQENGNGQFEVARNLTHYAKVDVNNAYSLHQSSSTDFGLLGNLFISQGKPGKVLKIESKHRINGHNFVTIIRDILNDHYKNVTISLGGVFLINTGKAKLHIMPDFSKTPLNCDEDVNKWLTFHEMDSPLVCLSVLHSNDPGLDLRVEHTHCFSGHNQGGHYHYDTTPQDVSYLAYLNIADSIFRIDQPEVTHQFGRN